MLNEILYCIQKWSSRSLYFDKIHKNLVQSNVAFKRTVSSSSRSMKAGGLNTNPRMPPRERVKMKIALLKETFYFLYSCFVLQALLDGEFL